MKWLQKSNYHLESDPPRFFLCKALVLGEWRYTLTDRNEWVITGTREECESEAIDRIRAGKMAGVRAGTAAAA